MICTSVIYHLRKLSSWEVTQTACRHRYVIAIHMTNHVKSLSYRFTEFDAEFDVRSLLYFAVHELFTCSYPLKVQACPPWDQRPALRSRVSGQGEEG